MRTPAWLPSEHAGLAANMSGGPTLPRARWPSCGLTSARESTGVGTVGAAARRVDRFGLAAVLLGTDRPSNTETLRPALTPRGGGIIELATKSRT